MLLDQFLKTYNEDNGWYGPSQHEDGRIIVSKMYRTNQKRNYKRVDGKEKVYSYDVDGWISKYYTLYKCVICEEYALAHHDALKKQYGAYQLQICCMNPSVKMGNWFKQLLSFTKLHKKLNNNFNKYSGIEFNKEIGEYYLKEKE